MQSLKGAMGIYDQDGKTITKEDVYIRLCNSGRGQMLEVTLPDKSPNRMRSVHIPLNRLLRELEPAGVWRSVVLGT